MGGWLVDIVVDMGVTDATSISIDGHSVPCRRLGGDPNSGRDGEDDGMMIAPYPDTECESVTEYNNKHYGKAWRIVGMTWQGDVYCTRPSCTGDWPTYENDLVESPRPVFATDDYDGMTCGECGGDLF